jgi:hypothetical protein
MTPMMALPPVPVNDTPRQCVVPGQGVVEGRVAPAGDERDHTPRALFAEQMR